MPTIDVTQAKILPEAQPGLQISPSAFTAEARAGQEFGREIGRFGERVRQLMDRIELLDAQKQIDETKAGYAEMLDQDNSERLTNKDFKTHRTNYETRHDNFKDSASGQWGRKAEGVLTPWLRIQRAQNATRIEANAYRMMAADMIALEPQTTQGGIDREAAENDPDVKYEIFQEENQRYDGMGSRGSGLLADAEVEGLKHTRVIMKAATQAELNPVGSVKNFASKKAMLKSGLFFKQEVELLTADDMDAIQEDARREGEAQRADHENKRRDENEALSRDFQAKIVDLDVPIAKTQKEFMDAVRSGRLEQNQISRLNAAIKSRISNAGNTATVEQKARADNEWAKAFHSGKLDQAESIAMQDAWMYSTPGSAVTRGRLDKIEAARNEPETAVNDTLNEFLSISEGMHSRMIEVLKATTEEDQLDIAGARALAKSSAQFGLEREVRNRQLREIFDRYVKKEITAVQMRTEMEEVVLPSQQEAAKAVTRGIWNELTPSLLSASSLGGIAGGGALGGVVQRGTRTFREKADIPTITTKAERDALATGTRYKDSQGREATR